MLSSTSRVAWTSFRRSTCPTDKAEESVHAATPCSRCRHKDNNCRHMNCSPSPKRGQKDIWPMKIAAFCKEMVHKQFGQERKDPTNFHRPLFLMVMHKTSARFDIFKTPNICYFNQKNLRGNSNNIMKFRKSGSWRWKKQFFKLRARINIIYRSMSGPSIKLNLKAYLFIWKKKVLIPSRTQNHLVNNQAR